jgi:hypothetical protein
MEQLLNQRAGQQLDLFLHLRIKIRQVLQRTLHFLLADLSALRCSLPTVGITWIQWAKARSSSCKILSTCCASFWRCSRVWFRRCLISSRSYHRDTRQLTGGRFNIARQCNIHSSSGRCFAGSSSTAPVRQSGPAAARRSPTTPHPQSAAHHPVLPRREAW